MMAKTIFLPFILPLFCSLVLLASTTTCALAEVQPEQEQQSAVQTGEAQGNDADQFEKQPSQLTNPKLDAGRAGIVDMNDQKFFIHIHTSDKVQVDVMNGLPPNSPPLIVHCKSKDDDFGNHTLARWGYFYWRFRPAFIASTLYWCNWYWGSKHAKFNVYDHDDGFAENQCMIKGEGRKKSNVCHWQARADGFYWTKELGIVQQPKNPNWFKKFDWGTISN
ncbi:hypothetical protein LguiB_025876 [Lonicera macranthoides]